MARLTDRGFSAEDAAEFEARSSQPHTLEWLANIYRWQGGVEVQLYTDLPIVGGTLSLDSSDPIRRHLTLEVGTVGELVPDQASDPLAPFGQVVKLWCRIDRSDGTWLPWLKQGEYPIVSTTSEWPSLIQTIECADYAFVVDQYIYEKKKSYNKQTVRNAIKEITEEALPDKVFTIHAIEAASNTKCEPHTVSEAGTSRWEMAMAIAASRGMETFYDSEGNLVIRRALTNDDNETLSGADGEPDIGTVSNPVAVIEDGPGGNLVALTTAVTREGAINGVVINLHETISQTLAARKKREAESGDKEDDPDDTTEDGEKVDPDDTDDDDELQPIPNPKAGDPRVNVQIQAHATGSIAWGDRFGRAPIVIEKNVKRINNSNVNAQKKRAKRLLHRRGGVIRSVDIDAVGLYWLEPDDKVRVKYAGRTEAHYVASIELDLSGESPARIRTRSLNVTDPG